MSLLYLSTRFFTYKTLRDSMNYQRLILLLILVLVMVNTPGIGQEIVERPILEGDTTRLSKEQQQTLIDNSAKAEAMEQLRDIALSLSVKTTQRTALRQQIQRAGDSVPIELNDSIAILNREINLLEETFEQIAIGDVDLSVFGLEEEKFDWREELITIVKPLLENVKSLTETPRKIENLRRVIGDKTASAEASLKALASIKRLQEESSNKVVSLELDAIEREWLNRKEALERAIQLAVYRLNNLEGKDVDWFDVATSSATEFFNGRGLTLLLVLVVALFINAFMRLLLWIAQARSVGKRDRTVKTHYRLVAYAYKILTVILIAVGTMMVLYFRQDLLLLAIVFILLIGAALALKNLLPRYIAEGRLLLNIGSVRERERVMYDGVPYQVLSINMHTRLANPEITGALRLPLRQLHDMISRPVTSNATWFPSSKGDWVLDDSEMPMEVLEQSVETVKLRDVNAMTRLIPTAEYYASQFRNLSKDDGFRVAIVFGLDYATQSIPNQDISDLFAAGLKQSFQGMPFEKSVTALDADFHSAGESSLNYLMIAALRPDAAGYYKRIKRQMQKSCVVVCNEQGWSIPFPQLTVHRATLEVSAKRAQLAE